MSLIAIGLAAAIATNDVPPVVRTSGSIRVSLESGRLEGDVCIADRPPQVRTHFSLNAGLNVARVTDGHGKPLAFDGWYRPGIDGEARVYEVKAPAPSVLCVSYVGAFPVYPAHDGPPDFKGVIAFDGESVRASEQSAWLPTPFDDAAKRRWPATAYDLKIACGQCRFIYLNGAPPVEQSDAHIVSRIARAPLLFAGKGSLVRVPGITLINESLSITQTSALASLFRRIADFHGEYMGISMGDAPIFLRMVTIDQVERDRKGSSWGFATWPTIALSGTVAELAEAVVRPSEQNEYVIPYLAHEAGHYYFGARNQPSGPYRWLLLESTAEFLGIKAQLALVGPDAVRRRTGFMADALKGKRFAPLDSISEEGQIDSVYRYQYAPLLLLELERRVGAETMRSFMRALLAAPSPSDWAEMTSIARQVGIEPAEWEKWRAECIADGTLACASVGRPM